MGNYLTSHDLVVKLQAKGIVVKNVPNAEKAIQNIGYYRLKGYFYEFKDQTTQQYVNAPSFEQILRLYNFDMELSLLISSYLSVIEVALRARLIEAFSRTQPDTNLRKITSSAFAEEKDYYANCSGIASDISRANNEDFIKHCYVRSDGGVPDWVAVEILTFGTLSKIIGNLKHDPNSPERTLASFYTYIDNNGQPRVPDHKMFASWIKAASFLRNKCAHSGRIYNKAFTSKPELLDTDKQNPPPNITGLYEHLLVMKYLRVDDKSWNKFVKQFIQLLKKYPDVKKSKLFLPRHWKNHLRIK